VNIFATIVVDFTLNEMFFLYWYIMEEKNRILVKIDFAPNKTYFLYSNFVEEK
jgi:hypothetical protein